MPQGSYTAVAIAGAPWEKMSDRAKEKYIESSFYGDLVDLNPEAKKAWNKIESKARDIARRGGDPNDWMWELPDDIRNQADFGEQWLAANPDSPVVPELRQRKDPYVKTIVNNGSFLSRVASKVGPRVVSALVTAGISEGIQGAKVFSDAAGFNPYVKAAEDVGKKVLGGLLTGNPVDPVATQSYKPASASDSNTLPDFANPNIPFDEYETPATKANNTGQIGQDSFKKINDVWTKVGSNGIPINTDTQVPGGLIGLPNDGGGIAKPTPVGLLSTETKRLADLKASKAEAARVADEKRISTEKKNLRLADEKKERARIEAEKVAKKKLESDRIAAKTAETKRAAETKRIADERRVAEQAAKARTEAAAESKRLSDIKAAKMEKARVLEEKRIADETENLRLAEEQRSRNEISARNKAEKLAAEKEKTRIESERVRLAAEQKQIETDRLAVEQVETDRLAAEQAEQVRIESERISAQTVEDGRVAAEQEAERTAVGSGAIAPGLLSLITENALSLATPGIAEATSDAIAPTFSSDITPGDGLIGVPTDGGISTGMDDAISSAVNPDAAMTGLNGEGVAPYVPITASDLTLSPPGIGEASADLVDSIDLGNGTTVGSKVGEMEGTFPSVPTDGGTTAGIAGTIAGLINTAGTGNEFGIPGLIGGQLANPVYDNLINNIKNPPVENYAPVEERSVEAGTGWAEGAPAAGNDWWDIAKKVLPFAPFIKPLINTINPPKTTQPKPFQFTPFNSTPVNAPETQRVFPQGGYYQQQANSMVPGGGQQMPSQEQYQGLLNSAFSRRV